MYTFRMKRHAMLAVLLTSATTLAHAGTGQSTETARPSGATREGAAQRADSTAITPTAAHLTTAQVLERNLAARGGLESWHHIAAMQMTGTMDVGKRHPQGLPSAASRQQAMMAREHGAAQGGTSDEPVKLPFVLDVARPRKVRLELQFAGATALQVYDGQRGWKVRPYLNRHDVESFTAQELKLASEQQDLDGLLIDAAAKGSHVELVGVESVEGAAAYKLKVTLKSGTLRNVWVDAKNFLEVKMDEPPRVLNGKAHAVATYLRDYRKVNGVMVPFVLETRVEHISDSQKIAINKVIINPQISDSQFTKPQA